MLQTTRKLSDNRFYINNLIHLGALTPRGIIGELVLFCVKNTFSMLSNKDKVKAKIINAGSCLYHN